MDFDLTEDQELLAKTVGDFAAKESPVERFRQLRDAGTRWEPAVWKQMAELGWLTVPFPESVGGFGGSFVEVALMLEQLGRTLVPEPFVPSVVLGGMSILRGGDAEQHARFLSPMMEGDTTLALAWTEPGGRFDPAAVTTRARRDGDGWTLDGSKTWVDNGARADHVVVSAATDEGLALFVVDRDAEGLTAKAVQRMDGHEAAMIRLEGVRVDADRRLSAGSGLDALEWALDHGAAAAVAEGVGLCQRVLDMTVEYLGTREQFGTKIGTFQALQHRAVDMFVETQLLRSISTLAMVKVDDDDPVERRRAVSAAVQQLSTGGKFVTRESIQLHGGVGVTDEHDVGLYFKRMVSLYTMYGDEVHHARRFASTPGFAESAGT